MRKWFADPRRSRSSNGLPYHRGPPAGWIRNRAPTAISGFKVKPALPSKRGCALSAGHPFFRRGSRRSA